MKTKTKITEADYIKAVKAADREIDMMHYGAGFKSRHHIHKSIKAYTRKQKHKKNEILEND